MQRSFSDFMAGGPHVRPDMRSGQAWMVYLAAVRPDLADLATGTDVDPYHDDTRLDAFATWIGENW